ncbi:MAG: diaminopimelate epimerase, partial [Acidimicrobiia bacterium]|nr:diaminopimelate epimerase [Acidimicrobiia bacterium]
MEFVKMQGLGNDFVVVGGDEPPARADVVAWCDRRRGIGADGVLRVTPSGGETAIRMEYWNADGSVSELCGNGLRCAARYGYDQGWAMSTSFGVATTVGVNRAEIIGPGEVRVELGSYVVGGEVSIGGSTFRCASVGNPHAVTFVPDPATAPLDQLGPMVEVDPAFPDRTNVEFASVDGDAVNLRVWERGI